ncbi:saccharopine dehydrogenase [Oleiphilus sp. HI0009]|uniref:saccharopine dehydrogenase family protein n=3 Tax=Oleiphilus TaxID=141450 RepID=UPI0007C34EA6|nr:MULTISPECIES: saccharopine dehydrogenase NADP-binding domain-containing protein [unclassified Oleiphilus]KZX82798.1 saccharopine dehydrogenase [Oleiphilus sp. HI0009]MCH2157566.1 saccharopine dehydrogenase NADP-binding domain-containing protein [Oleiphilaceae bacterium]KZY61449.1 saccharopine dehydrogenase [Oleiphilus sp. HI0066]KZY76909.1 saccharopine dehydrogenase [Oleiphilus sp. HI0067]KZZ59641.1 saccharopine dehydrogenase [Oleiphilus sp. HI0125]
MSDSREYDVIIWGASSFTGRLVAEFYLSTYGLNGELKWAMAGRNQAKLEEVRAGLNDGQGTNDIPILIADSHDEASLKDLVSKTKVICTTVGPYALYGNELVAACVEAGTDYCDLAGETQWIRRMIDQHHERAQETGARIIHCCGFDSIPSDLGTYFVQNKVKELKGEYAKAIKVRVKSMKGGASGGTIASINNVLAEVADDKELFKLLNNPYTLNPRDEMGGDDKRDLQSVKYDDDAKSFLMPFVMAAINTRVVRRSHALAGFPYGKDFTYDEAMLTGDGFSGRLKAITGLVGLGAMLGGKPGGFYKKITAKFLPAPGEGPSKAEREAGFWKYLVIAKMRDGSIVKGFVSGDRDPGYGSTSKMLGEAAACLALDKDKTAKVAGMHTPSTAMGDVLIERLISKAGLQFEIHS